MKPHFTIRDLLLVTIIVAMAVGWWLDHAKQAAVKAKYAERLNTIVSRIEFLNAVGRKPVMSLSPEMTAPIED